MLLLNIEGNENMIYTDRIKRIQETAETYDITLEECYSILVPKNCAVRGAFSSATSGSTVEIETIGDSMFGDIASVKINGTNAYRR